MGNSTRPIVSADLTVACCLFTVISAYGLRYVITHADESRGIKAFIHVCVSGRTIE